MKKLLSKKAFQSWLDNLPARIAELPSRLPDDYSGALDYSPESLEHVDAYLLANYPTNRSILKRDVADVFDGLASYLGETLRRHLGGQWSACIADRDHMYYGYPVLIDVPGLAVVLAPHAMILSRLHDRGGLTLQGLFSKLLQRSRQT